jgi:hypothetical protein
VTFNDEPVANKLVTFQVFDPSNNTIITRTNSTDMNGIAWVEFRLPSDEPFGWHMALATVEISEKMANDTMAFRVGWIVELLMVETVDQSGNPKTNFAKGEHVLFNVKLQNIAFTVKNVTLTINLYDEANTIIGVADYQILVEPGYEELSIVFNVLIPYWSFVGAATARADALTQWPWSGGKPYCPDVLAHFTVLKE